MANHSRKSAIKRRRIFVACCLLIIAIFVTGIVFIVKGINKISTKSEDKKEITSSYSKDKSTENETKSDEKDKSEEKGKSKEKIKLVSSATVINTGDIMVHSTQLDGAKTSSGYDFSDFFKYIKNYMSSADLAIGNLEVTFGGTQSGKFSGYPAFNTPDILADNIKDAGFDFLTTSNNHCYDTGLYGVKRTVSVLKEKGIDYVGTRESEDEKSYRVKNVNGIKLGITSFTFENNCDTPGRKSINGNIISTEANNLINSFSYSRLDEFYTNAQSIITAMKKEGADKVIFYMHWGEEYHLSENTWQKTIAQKLCNLGVDIIVGSHPHVIEPIDMLTAEGSGNKTVCIYSMGNAISNQRQEIMNPECTTGHTEDGMLFSYTFEKYSDGSVALAGVDIIPTWVNKYKGGSGYLYSIVPLDTRNQGESLGLSGTALTKSQSSYDRTKALLGAKLNEIQAQLGCKVRNFE